METFFTAHCAEFSAASEEQTLQNKERYDEFTALIGGSLDTFVDSQGLSSEEAFEILKATHEEDPAARRFVNMVLSTMEYDKFVQLMAEWAEEMK